jgi:hypothetical protein
LSGPGGRWRAALAALSGTALALAAYAALHDRAALAADVGRNAGIGPGLLAAARAPAAALVPALVGLRTWTGSRGATFVQLTLTAGGAAWLTARAVRGHDRALVLGGLGWVFGGYALTFCARAGEPGRALLETQRYHLFPMVGLVFLLAPALRRALSRFDARPDHGLWVATALAAGLLALHGSEMNGRARFLRYPDQARTLASIDRLGAICTRAGITRDQALAALDPIEPAWVPAGRNALVLLMPGTATPRVPDPLVKPTLLAALTPRERRSLCGGMDATPYLRPDDGPGSAGADALSVGRRVALFRVRDAGDGRCLSAGWPSFIEYELTGPEPSDARALGLPGTDPGGVVEVWWRGDRQRWSETRSVRLRLRSDPPHADRGWLLPLDRLPHWDPSEARRVRLLFHAAGPVAAAPPRLLR